MSRLTRAKKILIPDVSPNVKSVTNQGLVIAGIGVFCMSVVIAAVMFLFFGA